MSLSELVDLDHRKQIPLLLVESVRKIGLTESDELGYADGQDEGELFVILFEVLCQNGDHFLRLQNQDLPCLVSDTDVVPQVLVTLNHGDIIQIADRFIRYVGPDGSFRGLAPPKPRRSQFVDSGDDLNSCDDEHIYEEMDDVADEALPDELFEQLQTAQQIGNLSSSYVSREILSHTDLKLSSAETKSIFKAFQELALQNENLVMGFIKNFYQKLQVHTYAGVVSSIPEPVIKLLADLLRFSLEPLSHNIMWLRLLSALSSVKSNVPLFIANTVPATVMGTMAARPMVDLVQQYGCEMLANIASHTPQGKERAPVRHTGIELIVTAIRNHGNNIDVLHPAFRCLANLADVMTTIVDRIESSKYNEFQSTVVLRNCNSLLNCLRKETLPVAESVLLRFRHDGAISKETKRLIGHLSIESDKAQRKKIVPIVLESPFNERGLAGSILKKRAVNDKRKKSVQFTSSTQGGSPSSSDTEHETVYTEIEIEEGLENTEASVPDEPLVDKIMRSPEEVNSSANAEEGEIAVYCEKEQQSNVSVLSCELDLDDSVQAENSVSELLANSAEHPQNEVSPGIEVVVGLESHQIEHSINPEGIGDTRVLPGEPVTSEDATSKLDFKTDSQVDTVVCSHGDSCQVIEADTGISSHGDNSQVVDEQHGSVHDAPDGGKTAGAANDGDASHVPQTGYYGEQVYGSHGNSYGYDYYDYDYYDDEAEQVPIHLSELTESMKVRKRIWGGNTEENVYTHRVDSMLRTWKVLALQVSELALKKSEQTKSVGGDDGENTEDSDDENDGYSSLMESVDMAPVSFTGTEGIFTNISGVVYSNSLMRFPDRDGKSSGEQTETIAETLENDQQGQESDEGVLAEGSSDLADNMDESHGTSPPIVNVGFEEPSGTIDCEKGSNRTSVLEFDAMLARNLKYASNLSLDSASLVFTAANDTAVKSPDVDDSQNFDRVTVDASHHDKSKRIMSLTVENADATDNDKTMPVPDKDVQDKTLSGGRDFEEIFKANLSKSAKQSAKVKTNGKKKKNKLGKIFSKLKGKRKTKDKQTDSPVDSVSSATQDNNISKEKTIGGASTDASVPDDANSVETKNTFITDKLSNSIMSECNHGDSTASSLLEESSNSRPRSGETEVPTSSPCSVSIQSLDDQLSAQEAELMGSIEQYVFSRRSSVRSSMGSVTLSSVSFSEDQDDKIHILALRTLVIDHMYRLWMRNEFTQAVTLIDQPIRRVIKELSSSNPLHEHMNRFHDCDNILLDIDPAVVIGVLSVVSKRKNKSKLALQTLHGVEAFLSISHNPEHIITACQCIKTLLEGPLLRKARKDEAVVRSVHHKLSALLAYKKLSSKCRKKLKELRNLTRIFISVE